MRFDIRTKLLGVVAALAMGCAPEVGTIDRTQPNALHKDQFRGIWYYRATVVDSDPAAAYTVDGYGSGMDKLRWKITKKNLIGYRTYEFLPYAEGLNDEGRDFFGSPVVAYKIEGHFDIQRGYDKTTGIQTNVIEENTSDRPWFEREYVRVDWTKNVVGGLQRFQTGWTNFPEAFLSGVALAADYPQDHEVDNPNRPIFTEDYFDITNEYAITPDAYYCYTLLLFNGAARCGGQNVKVRMSFMKVDKTDDYEALYYPDNVELKDDSGNALLLDFNGRRCDGTDGLGTRDPSDCDVATFPMHEAFGNFRVQRIAMDKERFLTRTGRIYLAGRFDLWEDSWDDATGSLLPHRERIPKPITYYGNVEFPEELIPAARKLADGWNEPFMETVALLQGIKTADGRADLAAMREFYGEDFAMYRFEQNACNIEGIKSYAEKNGYVQVVNDTVGSLQAVDKNNVERVCAAIQHYEINSEGKTLDPKRTESPMAFTWQREGDLRYSFQNYVTQDQAGPWGVAQFATDPETGEYKSNNANYFGTAGDMIAEREVDKLQWLNGELDAQDILRGTITRNTVASRTGERNKSIRKDVRKAMMRHEANLIEGVGDRLFDGPSAGSDAHRFTAMFGGTSLERELLLNDEVLRAFAGPTLYQPAQVTGQPGVLSPGPDVFGAPEPGDVTEQALQAASPVNWGFGLEDNAYDKVVRDMGARAVEFMDFFEPTTSGLADFFKGKDREHIWSWLRAELYTSVQGHEVGHTLGLRHNFSASMDPLNYRPEYWETFFNQGEATPENAHRGAEYKYSSLMDYGFGVSLEGLHGIGPYDAAAIRFMYGQQMDVWDTNRVVIPDARKHGSFAWRCGHDSTGWGGLSLFMGLLHYTDIPRLLAPAGEGGARMEKLFEDLVERIEQNAASGQFNPSGCAISLDDINWLIGELQDMPSYPQNVMTARKPVDVSMLMEQTRSSLLNPPEYNDPTTAVDESQDGIDQDGDGVEDDRGYDWSAFMHRVDYDFCTDTFAGYGPNCQRWDTGADYLEAIDHHIDAYDRDYIFSSFRRDALGDNWYSPGSYLRRLQQRRFFHMTNVFRYYLFSRRSVLDVPLYDTWAEAAYRGVNFLERVIQTPEPGRYCLDSAENRYVPEWKMAGACDEPFDVGLGYGGGKYMDTSWTNEYYYKANRIGAFWDKLAAIGQLTSSSGRFIRDYSDIFDSRAFSLGYMRVYEDAMVQRFSSLLRGDHEGYESKVVTDPDTQEKTVRYVPFFDEALADDSSVQEWLKPMPAIEPSWSWTLQYWGLAYSLVNWSSIWDSAPEFHRFTELAIPGTPEDIEYPADQVVVEFTDPETRITYKAPEIESKPIVQLVADVPAYQSDDGWGIGAELLTEANMILTEKYEPAKADCDALTGVAQEEACARFENAHRELREHVGFLDIVRRFNRAVEYY